MNWTKIKEADGDKNFHAHFAFDRIGKRSDGVELHKGKAGIIACYPDGSHYELKYEDLMEGLPSVLDAQRRQEDEPDE